MNALIVLAHPEPRSFNAALAEAAREAMTAAGHEVVVSDLWRDEFSLAGGRADFVGAADPDCFRYQTEQRRAAREKAFAPDVAREQARLERADLAIFQFPLWWFGAPALLKGWFERVLAAGLAYGGGRWFETAPLFGRRAVLSITMGAKPDRWGEDRLFGPLEWCLHPLQVGTLQFCGFEVLKPNIVHAPAGMTAEERLAALDAWRRRCPALFSETPLPFRRAADFAAGAHRDQ